VAEARFDAEVMIELKLTGNHIDRSAAERALLRRQARQVQRVEQNRKWFREQPLWIVAPRVPRWLKQMRSPVPLAPGCYWVDPLWHSFLWIAANELPLVDELIPFLLVRSGRALDEFGRWVASRRPVDWMMSMLESVPMSTPTMEELMERFPPVTEPKVKARRQRILQFLLKTSPEARQALVDEGQLSEARQALRRVLTRRQLLLSATEDACIEGCEDLATLRRWLDQAITAHSAAEALR
jgi:hypothetical protein